MNVLHHYSIFNPLMKELGLMYTKRVKNNLTDKNDHATLQ